MKVPEELRQYLVFDTEEDPAYEPPVWVHKGYRQLLFKLRETFALHVIVRYELTSGKYEHVHVRAMGWNGYKWVYMGRRSHNLKGKPTMEPAMRDYISQRDPKYLAERQPAFQVSPHHYF